MLLKVVIPNESEMTLECNKVIYTFLSGREHEIIAQKLSSKGIWQEVYKLILAEDAPMHTYYQMNDEGKTIDRRSFNRIPGSS